MEYKTIDITPHPQFLDVLFAYKSNVFSVFRDVLGLYEINHIAISHINANRQLLTLSSTPAMEFNLFSSNLWKFDKTYNPSWFNLCSKASWQSLYCSSRYDELYYLKQIKHKYPLGCSLSAYIKNESFIFSIASRKSCEDTRDVFANTQDDFYKIGQYCTNALYPLLTQCESAVPPSTHLKVNYET